MTVDMASVRAELDREEPEYRRAADELGPDALPYLSALVNDADPLTAAKAVHLAAVIDTADSADVILAGAASPEAEVRVAAAGAAKVTSRYPEERLPALLGDDDAGVRKVALRSL